MSAWANSDEHRLKRRMMVKKMMRRMRMQTRLHGV
jgi:hypothetical protein